MHNKPIVGLLTLPLLAASLSAFADEPILGHWKTLDDETKKPMTVVEVYRAKGDTYAAKIIENIAAPATCDKCDGKDKGKSIIGMPVVWGVRKAADGYEGGEGHKLSSGMRFKVKSIKLTDGGKGLDVTGCKFVICKTAHWVRVD